jgi:hypothetical protein
MPIPSLYIAVANPTLSADRLRLLSYYSRPSVRRRVAEHWNVPFDVLNRLARDVHPEVRIAVGLNSRTPDSILQALITDHNPDVRYMLASSASTPYWALDCLSNDPCPYVQCRANRTLSRLKGEPVIHLVDTSHQSKAHNS